MLKECLDENMAKIMQYYFGKEGSIVGEIGECKLPGKKAFSHFRQHFDKLPTSNRKNMGKLGKVG